MSEYERTQRQIRERKSLATPLTKKVLGFSAVFYLLTLTICIGAFYHQVFAPFGIYTHPPTWVFVLAHLAASLAAIASTYSAMYLFPGKSKWLTGGIVAGLCYATTLAAIAWGVPNLSVHLNAEPVTREAEVVGSSSTKRKSAPGCQNRLMFGPWYAPGGSACYNITKPSMMIGSIIIIEGVGNEWATRITSINGTFHRSEE